MDQMTGDLWKLVVAHPIPISKFNVLSRAALCRTVHGLVDHGALELVAEHSRPEAFSFTVLAPQDVREGLYVVAKALSDDWLAGWVKMQPFRCPRCKMVSQHPEDAEQGYCGNCHDWTGGP